MNSIVTTRTILSFPAPLRPLLAVRLYATQTGLGTTGTSQQPRRKAVTAFNDDGRVAWGDLTAREKIARTAQQSFNFSFIILGAVLTVCTPYKRTRIVLTFPRLEWHMLCIPKFSPQIARLHTLAEPSIKLRMTRDVRNFWGTARRSQHMESHPGTNGEERGQLRMLLESISWSPLTRWQVKHSKGSTWCRAPYYALQCRFYRRRIRRLQLILRRWKDRSIKVWSICI
jgi:hypothetical protein